MQLPNGLVSVIMRCVTLCVLSILWNEEETKKFKLTRGIRQVYPLSPCLFVVSMEQLCQLIEQQVSQGRWRPFLTSHNGPRIPSLLFADDVVLFTEALREQAQVIQNVVDQFCRASRQKISSAKLNIFFSANTEV